MELGIKEIIKENNIRNAKMHSYYDPIKGVGSPIPRFKFYIDIDRFLWLPNTMKEEPLITGLLENYRSLDNYLLSEFGNLDKMNEALGEVNLLRFTHDFEFWAIMKATIQDKNSKREQPFKLNHPQKIYLKELEEMRVSNVPIRIILLKARQWGGSTLTEMYMAWIQTEHKLNWHSVIIADVESQARNIRSMYTRFVKRFPKSFGELTLAPFENSTKNKIIKERGCVLSIGSAQKPDSLRSTDNAMCHFCLTSDTFIPTKDGIIKRVNKLKVGDSVITHNGNLSEITNITWTKRNKYNGNGTVVKIHPWLNLPIEITPNHPIYTDKGFVQAGNLTKDHYILLPIREITNEIKYIPIPYSSSRALKSGTRCTKEGELLELNADIGFVFGYYLAEGSLHYDMNTKRPNEISFARHDNEYEYGDKVKKILIKYTSSHHRYKRKNSFLTREIFYGVSFAILIENLLSTKNEKRIPDWFFKCGKNFLKGLLKGYLLGDGSKKSYKWQKKYDLATLHASSVSSSISLQIRDIALSLGFGLSSIYYKKAGVYYNRNCQEIYTLSWNGNSARKLKDFLNQERPYNGNKYAEKSFVKDGYAWIKIKSIEKRKSCYKGFYDIEVKHDDHSFRTISFCAKNSEAGFFKKTENKKPEDLIRSIRETIPDEPYTLEVLESTANGFGTFFHKEFLDAKEKRSGYKAMFIPWFSIERDQLKIKEIEFVSFIETYLFGNTKKCEYNKYLWKLGATLEGIKWYNNHKKSKNYKDIEMFAENPSSEIEAFQSTGRRVYSSIDIENMRSLCSEPIYKGQLFGETTTGDGALKNLRFEEVPGGELWIWKMPDKQMKISRRYTVSMDIGGKSKAADWSIIRVFDRYNQISNGPPEAVATWRGHVHTDILGWIGVQISKFYNYALFIPEANYLVRDNKNTEGSNLLTILNEIGEVYTNIFTRISIDDVREGMPTKYGFWMTEPMKGTLSDLYMQALRGVGYIEHDSRVLDEAEVFEVKDNGKLGAADGYHDDLLITTQINYWACVSYMDMPFEIKYDGRYKPKPPTGIADF